VVSLQVQLVARRINRDTARRSNHNTIMTRGEGDAPTRGARIIVLPDDQWTAGRTRMPSPSIIGPLAGTNEPDCRADGPVIYLRGSISRADGPTILAVGQRHLLIPMG
jgi:hypothetical protein